MEQKNGRFRKKKVFFTQVSNNALRDNELSLKAKGLYSLIQSYITMENFTLYKGYLKSQCKEGEKAFESTWKELKDAGYLIQYRLQDDTLDENNKKKMTFYYEYELLDNKNIELAKKVHASQNRKSKEEKSHNPKKEGMGKNQKAIPTKRDGMDNGYDGEGGIYNNTDPNNTNLNNTYSEEEETFQGIINKIESNLEIKLNKKKKEIIDSLLKSYSIELFNKALDIALLKSNNDIISYIQSTLQDWNKKGLNSLEKVEDMIQIRKSKTEKIKKNREKSIDNKSKNNSNSKKIDTFNDFDQRDYDFDDLEKKLLESVNNNSDSIISNNEDLKRKISESKREKILDFDD
ncbi:RNA replicase (plasmid) [Clostridium botulinum]|uniref:DnaD domain protein n=1 Tax=Clostridium botulinum TaxID=1491 RepID=UPI002209EEAA|nr:DnaD domain protein [Clostridium botulinum]QDY23212.1 RNA replicase [Clostridium botulinum]